MDERRPERPVEEDGTAHLFRAVGKQVKVLRKARGLHQRELAELTHVGEDLISAIERGVRTPQPDFLERADKVLDAGGVLLAVVDDVREALARSRTRHPDWYRGYAELEAQAVELHHYCNHALHGLLQIEAHAETVFAKRRPLLDEETIAKRTSDRLARQQVFERKPAPVISYILEEVILNRPTGGRAVHKDQLRHLLRVGQMRNVEIQIMPTAHEGHPNLDSAFNLVTPKGQAHQVAYTEAQGNPRLITNPEDVRMIAERYGIMRAQALNAWESLALIERKLGEQ
ncbi:helix-turn-helix transcriptional regulator [Streptomyces sp. T-3]|nr:helix-turn-helix transcriptional regulator [Streptomyces sp. T-3]